MAKIVAIDTNVLLDFRLKRQPGFAKAQKLISEVLSKKIQILIPNIVFPEIEWVLRSYYKQPKDLIVNFLEALLVLEGVILEDKSGMQQSVNIFRETSLKFTDAIILVQVQKFKPDEFLTFDENLRKFYQVNLPT